MEKVSEIIIKYKRKYDGLQIQIKASFWFLLCSFCQKAINTIVTPFITRLLTTEEYGVYSVFNSWMSIFIVFVTLNLYAGVYAQGVVKFNEDKKVFTSTLQGLTLTIVICWTAIYLVFRSWINQILGLTTLQCILMIILMWATSSYNFWATYQRTNYKYRELVFVTLLTSLLKPIIGIALALISKNKVTALIIGFALTEFIIYGFLFLVQMKNGKRFHSSKYWTYAIKFNIPLIPHYLSQTLLNSSDRIIIKQMIGTSEAGIYNLAYSISFVTSMFSNSLSSTISPWMYKKIKEKDYKSIPYVCYFSMVFIAIVNLLLIAFAPEIVSIFAPKSYKNAIYVIPPITMSVYFIFLYSIFSNFEFYFEKTKSITSATIISSLLNIILNYIFIKKYGYYAAGYTTLVCYILYAIFHYLSMNSVCIKNYGNKIFDGKILLLISSLFIVSGFVIFMLYKYTLLRYFAIISGIFIIFINRKRIISIIKTLYNSKYE